MGIKGLLPKFEEIQEIIDTEDLSGETVGIDASTWLYAILMKYSIEILTKPADPKQYVNDFISGINVLLQKQVVPIIVFDGDDLPAKMHTKIERRINKQQAKAKALHFICQNAHMSAKLNADRAVDVTNEIVDRVMQELDDKDIHWIQAPFEADAQLAYMANAGVIQYVISTDSDLLVYGTPRVYCILCGCDYLKSVRGIGLNLAERFMIAVADKDLFQETPQLGQYVGRHNLEVPVNYTDDVKKALFVFQHQAVFDVGLSKITPCTLLDNSQHIPPAYHAAAGLSSSKIPPYSASMKSIWMSLEDLDISGLSGDITWTPDGQRPEVTNSITNDGHTIVWVPPCLPVLKVPLWLGQDSNHRDIAIHLNDNPDLPDVPFKIKCTKTCTINVNGQDRMLLWRWTICNEEVEEEEERDEWDSESEEEGDDVVVLDEEVNDDEGEQTLNFKVLGVTYRGRQNYIECIKELMANGLIIPVQLIPEPHNQADPGGIAVVCDTGVTHFGRVCVGYLPKEFKDCITSCLSNNKITDVKIQHIRLRTQFNPIQLGCIYFCESQRMEDGLTLYCANHYMPGIEIHR